MDGASCSLPKRPGESNRYIESSTLKTVSNIMQVIVMFLEGAVFVKLREMRRCIVGKRMAALFAIGDTLMV